MSTYYLVRHGETDYKSVDKWKNVSLGCHFANLTKNGIKQLEKTSKEECLRKCQIIIASPYTRAVQSAAVLATNLNLPLTVETDLHEWITDKSYSVTEESKLLDLCHEFDECKGVYPIGVKRIWEEKKEIKERVLGVLNKYKEYEHVIVVGHAVMIQTMCPGDYINNGDIRKYELK